MDAEKVENEKVLPPPHLCLSSLSDLTRLLGAGSRRSRLVSPTCTYYVRQIKGKVYLLNIS